MKLTYPRYHIASKDCDDLHPFINLGGRHYLSTTAGTVKTNVGTLTVSPLTVYHFPCNITLEGMRSGLSRCPPRLEISLPIFKEQLMEYVPWDMKDNINLRLHYNSLKIRKATRIDDNITLQLSKLYNMFDRKLGSDINAADEKIDTIK